MLSAAWQSYQIHCILSGAWCIKGRELLGSIAHLLKTDLQRDVMQGVDMQGVDMQGVDELVALAG